MGYQALLFCPDEKTARTVTQVLNELEFNVESCIEPFAAVKKLMGQHFDAVVVDCDNEQNATLLFKSARNSTSNQTSLAVAVVEGQAGVAKAFRIGANLVLTKPINIEQAKGTLRVARGLLRKADPAKPGVPAASAPAAAPAKPGPAPLKPISSVKPTAPATMAPKPAEVPVARPAGSQTWPAAAAASAPAAKDPEPPQIKIEEQIAVPVASAAAPAIAKARPAEPVGIPTASPKPAFSIGSSGAASAPAPARMAPEAPAAEIGQNAVAEPLVEKPAEAAQTESSAIVGSAPSFTFGASAEPAAEGGKKKIFIGIAAVVVLAGSYFGYTALKGHPSAPATGLVSAPAGPAIQPKPNVQPAPVSSAPSPSSSSAYEDRAAAAKDDTESADITLHSSASAAKPSKSAPAPSAKDIEEEEAVEPAPLVVKGGKVAPHATKGAAASEVAAPSMAGLVPGTTPPPNFVPTTNNAFKPVLQTLNISQGVSQGLLTKKISPSYPPNALRMHIEGVVELLATVSKEGNISHIRVVSGDPQLTKAASDAVKQWKYKPYLLNGEPVEIQTQITVNFKLPR
jgi:periplasmic protein TonB